MKNYFKIAIAFAFVSFALAQSSEARTPTLFARASKAMPVPTPAAGPKVLYFGGPVIANVKVLVVFWGNKVDKNTVAKIGGFYSSITNSDYLDWMKEYDTNIKAQDGKLGSNQHIGRGKVAGTFTIVPINTNTKLDKTDVEAELVKQMDQGSLPKPDANTLYMMHFPSGITLSSGGENSCSAWCGDHEGFNSPKYGNVYYAMMPDLGGSCTFGCGFASNPFDSLTVISSHELSEAITDPMCPNIGSDGARPAAWLAKDQNEIGDLCTDSSGDLKSGGVTYTVEGEWDNSINGCKAGHFTSAFVQ